MTISLGDFLAAGQHPEKYVEPLPWMEECRMELVTEDTLDSVIDECVAVEYCALDVETTGLDDRVFNGRTVDSIVGFCLSPNENTGFYIPIRHRVGAEHNLSVTRVEDAIRRLCAGTICIFHNAKFDQEFLEFNGGEPIGNWESVKTWEDTLILYYLFNSRAKQKGLKFLSKTELGCEMFELEDLFPKGWAKKHGGYNYADLNPSDPGPLYYGCSDGICTTRLFQKFYGPVVRPKTGHTQARCYLIEKACVPATRAMQRNRMLIDKSKVKELVGIANRDLLVAMEAIYKAAEKILGRDIRPGFYKWLRDPKNFNPNDGAPLTEWKGEAKVLSKRTNPDPVGRIKDERGEWPPVYDLFSDAQLGAMFDECKVPGLSKTPKSGQIATGADVLDKVIANAGKKFPWMKDVGQFRQNCTALSNYLVPMTTGVPEDGWIRINFNGHKVDTGRFSTPTRDKNRPIIVGWPKFNLQSVPATYNDPEHPKPEAMLRLRECFIAPPGYFIVAIDFSGEELRIVTNLSREPIWVQAFFQCIDCGREWPKGDSESWPPAPPPEKCPCGGKTGDLHSVTGDALFPGKRGNVPEDTWKALRNDSKTVNFQLCYGGGGSTVSKTLRVPINEGWRIARQFQATYKGLGAWWETQRSFGRQNGYVLTPFGRKYPVPDINLPVQNEGGKDKNAFWRSKAERNAINGPVQASGGDIIKIGMAKCHKIIKANGWEDDVRGIITMHDELVFMIKGELLDKAIPVLADGMVNNGEIRRKKWPIPFTFDAEIGLDWTVPWDYMKCKRSGKWPDELRPFFPEKKAEDPEGGGGGDGEGGDGGDTEEGAPPSPPPESPKEAKPHNGVKVEATKYDTDVKDGVFTFKLMAPRSPGTVHKLASVIHKCRDSGTRRLRIKDAEGVLLEGWEEFCNDGEPLYVNDQMFYLLAQEEKL